jgi:hypothetical protein
MASSTYCSNQHTHALLMHASCAKRTAQMLGGHAIQYTCHFGCYLLHGAAMLTPSGHRAAVHSQGQGSLWILGDC